jgi:DNA polymerase/3'-5' exonuclease PolX
MVAPFNDAMAGKLREMADVLEQQQADGFRIAAYRRAADTLESLKQPGEEIVRTEGSWWICQASGAASARQSWRW